MAAADQQDFVPILSPGKHRNPRRGGCFMEMASYLAGEPWSDNPSCTHPLLSSMARLVNDHGSDQARATLTVLIPSVIGLNSDGIRWYAVIARCAALSAFPEAPAERQNALAVGLLTTEQTLADVDELPLGTVSDQTRAVLAQAPQSAQWARTFRTGSKITPKAYLRRSAPAMVRLSVDGILNSVVGDSDARLCAMLTDTIAVCQGMMPMASRLEEPQIRYRRTANVIP